MSGFLGHASLLGTAHAALSCTTDAAGQAVCTNGSTGLFAGLGIAIVLIYLAVAVIGIIAAVKVVTKAGYSGWWVLIAFIPLVGSVFVLIFAFSTWPVTREVQMLRTQLATVGGYGGPGLRGGYDNYGSQGSYGAPSYRPPGPVVTPQGPTPPAAEADAATVDLPTFGQFIRGETDPVAPSPGPTAAAPIPAASGLPPAGWFPSPGGPPGQQRYWDGTAWTDHYQ
jgi:hypothetical protein